MQHDPTEVVESRRVGAGHRAEGLDLVFAELSVPRSVPKGPREHSPRGACCSRRGACCSRRGACCSRRAACGAALLTHRVGRFHHAAVGHNGQARVGHAHPATPCPNRNARCPLEASSLAHLVTPPSPHRPPSDRHARAVPKRHAEPRDNTAREKCGLVQFLVPQLEKITKIRVEEHFRRMGVVSPKCDGP